MSVRIGLAPEAGDDRESPDIDDDSELTFEAASAARTDAEGRSPPSRREPAQGGPARLGRAEGGLRKSTWEATGARVFAWVATPHGGGSDRGGGDFGGATGGAGRGGGRLDAAGEDGAEGVAVGPGEEGLGADEEEG